MLSKDETISDLIERAGGLKNTGDQNAIKMYRISSVEENKNEIDFFDDDEEIVNGFFSDGEFVQIVPLNEEKDAINNIKTKYYEQYIPVHVELKKALKYQSSKYNIVLNDRDSIFIPITQDLITITGALSNFDEPSISVFSFRKKS